MGTGPEDDAREGADLRRLTKPPSINDKALAAVDSEWRTAREIYAILDEGAFISTVAAASCERWQNRTTT